MKVSIAIPYHNTPQTAFFLARPLRSISPQTYKNYEVILTNEGPFARNHNAAIQKATGDIVQMLQMDDYLAHPEALQNIVDGFKEGVVWQISGCVHDNNGMMCNPHEPQWTDDIYTGNNRLGSVSTLSFRRENTLLFEEPLTWVVDTDLYYRFYLKYGLPYLNNHKNLAIDVRNDRLSHTLSDELKAKEVAYCTKKYGK